jgi:hypothetical protein
MATRVGDRGQAISPLYPTGKVVIAGVTHEARSECGPIDRGCPVVVVGGDRFSLIVRAAEAAEGGGPPGQGAVVLTPDERVAEVEGRRRREDELQARHDRFVRRVVAAAGAGGSLVAGAALALARGAPDGPAWEPWATPPVAGALGAGLALWLYALREEIGCVSLGLVGLLVGGAVGVQALGLLTGVVAAFGVAFGCSLLPYVAPLLLGWVR